MKTRGGKTEIMDVVELDGKNYNLDMKTFTTEM